MFASVVKLAYFIADLIVNLFR